MFKLISVLLPDESYWHVVFSFCICSMVIGPDSQVIPIEYFSVPISHSSIHAGVGVAVGSAAGGIGVGASAGPAGVSLHPVSNKTNSVQPNTCCHSLLLLIHQFLCWLRVVVLNLFGASLTKLL